MPRIAEQWLHKVLDVMYLRRTVTRAQIVQATRLNPASVSHTLQHLLQRSTILKVGELRSKAGRRRDVLTLNSEAGYFMIADLEGTCMRFAITNFVGDVRYRWEEDLAPGQTLELSEVVEGMQMVLRNLPPSQQSRIIAIGVSCPGIYDKSGRVTAVNLGWHKVPLPAELEKAFKLPVYLEHPTRCGILAERWVGLAQNARNFVFVTVGIGVGAGIFSNGRFLGGRDQMGAGELGHIRIDPSAPDACRCGKNGCLEAIVSTPNLIRQYTELTHTDKQRVAGLRLPDLFEKYRQGDANAQKVISRATKHLGLALSYLVNLHNPELIILGDDIISGEDIYLPQLRSEVEQNSLPQFLENLDIRVSRIGRDIGLKGAAFCAFRNALADSTTLRRMCQPAIEAHDATGAGSE